MNRREFLKKTVLAAIAAGFSPLISTGAKLTDQNNIDYDVIALKNGTPEAMFERGIAALGGIGRFVDKNQTVLIKPNMSFASGPDSAANTNPQLVSTVIKHCLDAGAKKVYVIDHTLVYKSEQLSGIKVAAEQAGAEVYPANEEKYYHEVSIPGGKTLKKTQVHKLVTSADVFINVPILKNHGGAKLTCALKNLMGVVWDRRYYHRNNLDQCIADFPLYRKPVLNIVDAYRVMIDGGPRGRDNSKVIKPEMQFISTDIVAVDAVSHAQAKAWSVVNSDVDYIKMAYDLKLGEMNLSKLKIKKITL
jgi:uncharacterized protein (DUF362 family)